MALFELLLAGDAKQPTWIEAGTVMIAIDTLVHNFPHRTGILGLLGADHPYGAGCYRLGGLRRHHRRISEPIDAEGSTPPSGPTSRGSCSSPFGDFAPKPGLNRCNGRRIDDRARCEQADCPVFEKCGRVPLKPA